jgi:hypothetical protein
MRQVDVNTNEPYESRNIKLYLLSLFDNTILSSKASYLVNETDIVNQNARSALYSVGLRTGGFGLVLEADKRVSTSFAAVAVKHVII